jgi:hypothetical protein
MKKIILYSLIVLLYLLGPVCMVAGLGTMTTIKYEVDHGYYLVETKKHLSPEQKQAEILELDKRSERLWIKVIGLFAIGVGTMGTATVLWLNRTYILYRLG